MKQFAKTIGLAFTLVAASLSMNVQADNGGGRIYKVTVTNITKGQSFTPILGVAHSRKIKAFEVGEPASEALSVLAEGGNVAPLQTALESSRKVGMTASTDGLLHPGESTTIKIKGKGQFNRLTLAAMLIPTNDTFMAVNSIKLPTSKWTKTVYASAYDAGSETNDENCLYIPGPVCGGEGVSVNDQGEGYIYPSPGISGEADLSSLQYNWQGAVAKVEIKRVY